MTEEDAVAEDFEVWSLRAEVSRLATANMTRGRELTERETELAAARARIAELEKWVTDRDERIACLEDELAEARDFQDADR